MTATDEELFDAKSSKVSAYWKRLPPAARSGMIARAQSYAMSFGANVHACVLGEVLRSMKEDEK